MERADSGDSSLSYICSALSQDDGTFAFPSLASGEYTVVSCPHFKSFGALLKTHPGHVTVVTLPRIQVPFYRGERITFDVAPSRMDFKVEHNSLKLEVKRVFLYARVDPVGGR